VVESLPGTYEALVSIPAPKKKKKTNLAGYFGKIYKGPFLKNAVE
jgi:hypothetical protein